VQVTADGAEALAGQRDQLRRGLGGGEQHQDGGAGLAEQGGQRLRGGGLSVVPGQHARALVGQGVTMRLVPGDPAAGARGDRDEEQRRAGDLARRPVEGVDLQAAVAQPAHAGTHAGQSFRPAAAAELSGARRDVRLHDRAARGPVGQDGVRPHPLEHFDGPARQIVGGGSEPDLQQIGGDFFGPQVRDEPQFVAERRFALADGRHRDEHRSPPVPGGDSDERGDDRVVLRVVAVSGVVNVEPLTFARMRRHAAFEREQAGGGLGERRDDEPAGGQAVGADLPPPHDGHRPLRFRLHAKPYRPGRPA
jgi:hypothetical protein